ncbi:MAG: alpha-L-fucosidase [Clostridia bacterium]|nr:alpha-L-fucosidase [Clostridia bacterium]
MSSYKVKKTDGNMEWFIHDRFGMFIHFGLYSMPSRHEWVKTVEKISEEHYDKYFKYFNPDKFDAKEWARKAKDAGMKYAVMTAKHHEGFCLFDSKYTDYKSTKTPAKKDFIKEFVDAFREAGLKVGIYYSLIDWHHPDFQIDIFHPRRAEENAQELNKTRDMVKYREYMFNQVRELLTNYGKIDILWFDFTYPDMDSIRNEYNQFAIRDYKEWMPWTNKESWDSENLIKMIRSINPEIIINDRTGILQDIKTPEQTTTSDWPKYPGSDEYMAWEACHTFSGSWGYYRDEMSWKTPEMLIRILVRSVSGGGNLIMNVGPTSRGNFDKRADKALEVFKDWMNFNSRSIYGCTKAEPEFKAPQGTVLTQSDDGKRLYIHLLEYPYSEMNMTGMKGKIDYAQLLHDGSEIRFREEKDGSVSFIIPGIKPDVTLPVLELFLREEV